MTELEKMVENARQVYNRLQVLQQEFADMPDPYRNQAFRTDVLMAFSHTFDLAYDLNRYWSKLAEVPSQHTYEIATPDGVIIREAKAKGFQPIVTCKCCERQVRRDLAFKTPEGEFVCEECDKE